MDSFGFPEPGSADVREYFCHQCRRHVAVVPSAAVSIACPLCDGVFLVEVRSPDPPPPFTLPNSFFPLASPRPPSPLPFLLSPSNSFELRSPRGRAEALGSGRSSGTVSPLSAPFSPLHFLQDYMQQLVAGGANMPNVLDGGSIGDTGNLADYPVGPSLDELIQQFLDDDPNRYGTPPAATSAVESLPDIKISPELAGSNETQCTICNEVFDVGDCAKQMPCNHVYHKDCIFPWLRLHNSCPVCRYELPTDDPDYERHKGALEARPPLLHSPFDVHELGSNDAAGIGDGDDRNAGNGDDAGANSSRRE